MNQRPSAPALAGTTALDHLVFASSHREDRRLKLALVATATLHLALLAVVLPAKPERAAAVPDDRPIFVIKKTPKFRKPPVPQPPAPKPPKKPTVVVPLPEPPPIEPMVDLVAPEPPPLPIPDAPVFTVPIPPPPAPPAPAPAPPEPLRVGAGVELPARTFFVEPQYTNAARRIRTEGMVILDTIIGRDGNIRDVKVLRGLPLGLTDEAVRAVSQWQFEPPTVSGKPVELAYVVTVRFQLR